jgi:hypothetical protein
MVVLHIKMEDFSIKMGFWRVLQIKMGVLHVKTVFLEGFTYKMSFFLTDLQKKQTNFFHKNVSKMKIYIQFSRKFHKKTKKQTQNFPQNQKNSKPTKNKKTKNRKQTKFFKK